MIPVANSMDIADLLASEPSTSMSKICQNERLCDQFQPMFRQVRCYIISLLLFSAIVHYWLSNMSEKLPSLFWQAFSVRFNDRKNSFLCIILKIWERSNLLYGTIFYFLSTILLFKHDFLFDWPQIFRILSKIWFWASIGGRKILTNQKICILTKM